MHVDVFGQSAIHLHEFNILDHAKSLGPTMLPLSPSKSKVGASKTLSMYVHIDVIFNAI